MRELCELYELLSVASVWIFKPPSCDTSDSRFGVGLVRTEEEEKQSAAAAGLAISGTWVRTELLLLTKWLNLCRSAVYFL